MSKKRKAVYATAAFLGIGAIGAVFETPPEPATEQYAASENASQVLGAEYAETVSTFEVTEPEVQLKTETLTEAISHGSEIQYSSAYEEGSQTVSQQGVDGTETITYEVEYADGVETSRTEVSRTVTVQPVKEIVLYGTKPAQVQAAQTQTTTQQPTQSDSSSSVSVPEPEDEPVAECEIKGNISYRTGEKIYHVPGQQYYTRTQIDTSDGERWFCSEDEAIRAGWRKSKV